MWYSTRIPTMLRPVIVALTLALLAGCGGDIGFDTTPTPSPIATLDAVAIPNCPGFTPMVEIINGTPYVILAAACTPTPTWRTPPLTPLATATPFPICYDIEGTLSAGCRTPTITPNS